MSELKQRIIKGIEKHINLDDTYFYILERVKKAFVTMTITLDDFVEMNEDDVKELANAIYDEITKQPTLNENQQIVLAWLKEDESQSFKEALGDFYFYVHHGYRISEAYEQLSEKEFAQVIELFAKWAQEQEEE